MQVVLHNGHKPVRRAETDNLIQPRVCSSLCQLERQGGQCNLLSPTKLPAAYHSVTGLETRSLT